MEYAKPTSGEKSQCPNSDMIRSLPQNIIESILSLMPLQDALRTSILSKKWRYSWRNMPKLAFTDEMGGYQFRINLTFVDLLQFVPLIQSLDISNHYIKSLFAGGMPHKLLTSLVHLKYLYLSVCLMKQNEISFALCMIKRSPMLEKIKFRVYDDDDENLNVEQTPTDILDLEDYPDLKLDHLETMEIEIFGTLPVVTMDFVKLIMAKSSVLKIVRIVLHPAVSVDEEVKMLRDLVLLPFPRASPSAKLIVARR